jgi:hypothetical protein
MQSIVRQSADLFDGRDQQKWTPVLRPIAPQYQNGA